MNCDNALSCNTDTLQVAQESCEIASCTQDDRTKLKEQRAIRNKQKKIEKQIKIQKEREQNNALSRRQPINTHLSLVSQDFVQKLTNSSTIDARNAFQPLVLTKEEFPAIGEKSDKVRHSKKHTSVTEINEWDNKRSKKHGAARVSIAEFLAPVAKPIQQQPSSKTEVYRGNSLDSALPERKWGKHRETPKIKRLTQLKASILKEKDEVDDSGTKIDEENDFDS